MNDFEAEIRRLTAEAKIGYDNLPETDKQTWIEKLDAAFELYGGDSVVDQFLRRFITEFKQLLLEGLK